MRKIELMHYLYGKGEGKCAECCHFRPAHGGWSKCKIYGDSGSEATDWNHRYPACGLKNQKDVPDKNVVKMVRSIKQVTDTEGQISLFD